MQTQANKLSKGARKRVKVVKGMNCSSGAPILREKTSATPPVGHGAQQADFQREKEAMDTIFPSMLGKANQELAKLLRDVHRKTQAETQGGMQNRRSSDLLHRAVNCATKQYMLQAEMANLALKDELTGFYNRRGFQALAERQLKLGRRSGREMLLFFIDVDGLKETNDSFGHAQGDKALKSAAEVLKKTFRDSDIITRLGGDEFAVLAIEASDHGEDAIMARMREYLEMVNARETQFTISFSVGVARFDHGRPASVGDLLAEADRAMYVQKRCRPNARIAVGAGCPC
jgi:diguanylate cyclase (GGDEF)-like protein